MRRHLRQREPLACILDIFNSGAPIPLAALRDLRHRHPTIAILVASDFRGREMDLYLIGRLKVDGVIRLEELPGARAIREAMENAVAASVASMVLDGPGAGLPPLAAEALRWAIEHADRKPQVSDLAAALALEPRTLLRELRAEGVGPPRTVLLWGRLLWASYLLERSHETVESVAFRLGYASGGGLGKALKQFVGCSPRALAERGGLSWTLEVFQRKGLRRSGGRRKRTERWPNARTSRQRLWSTSPGRG